MHSQLYLGYFGIATDTHAGKDERPMIICHAFYQATAVDTLMGCVNGNIITAFADIEFPMPIGVVASGTDTATIERRPLSKQATGVVLLTSVIASTAIWRNYALDGSLDVLLVAELHARRCDSAPPYDPDAIRGVDHDFGDLGIPKQLLEGIDCRHEAATSLRGKSSRRSR